MVPTQPFFSRTGISLAYTPGMAAPCLKIKDNPETSFDYSNRGSLIGSP
ncbi:hypothetical protein [uncultured Desulfosarcina sp.]|nr:hypothetical protein [uncultured Desulfosarcina sp.]